MGERITAPPVRMFAGISTTPSEAGHGRIDEAAGA